MRNKLVVTGLTVLAAFVIACSSTSKNTDSHVGGDGAPAVTDEGPVTAAMGQTVTLTSTTLGSTDKVEITLANPQQADRDPESSFIKPSKGVYLALSVTVVCDEGTYLANPYNFKFVAADGSAYDPAITIGFEPHLDSVTLNAGQRTAGNLVFDVPAAAITGAKIQVNGIGLDTFEPAAYWAL